MAVTTITLGGLNINDGISYAVHNDTLYMLEAMAPHDAVMVEMPGRPPWYVRSQIGARPISLTVVLLAPDALDRKADFDAIKTACDPTLGLVTLQWTDDAGPVTKTLTVHTSSCIPTNWFTRANAELVAPNPEPIIS